MPTKVTLALPWAIRHWIQTGQIDNNWTLHDLRHLLPEDVEKYIQNGVLITNGENFQVTLILKDLRDGGRVSLFSLIIQRLEAGRGGRLLDWDEVLEIKQVGTSAPCSQRCCLTKYMTLLSSLLLTSSPWGPTTDQDLRSPGD